jgi:hypothetical protein
MTDTEALLKAKDIAGKTRLIQGQLHTENPEEVHRDIDKLMLDLLKEQYPELVKFRMSLRLWYG